MAGKQSRLVLSTVSKFAGTLRNNVCMLQARYSIPLTSSRIAFRGLSEVATEQEDAAVVLRPVEGLELETGSEMPFMVPTHVVRKAFEVHMSPRYFALRPNEKSIWLTKTYLTTGMPEEVDNQDSECSENVLQMFKDTIHQVTAFQINPTRASTTLHEEEFSLGLLQDFLRIILCTGPRTDLEKAFYIHPKPLTETNWFRNFKFFHSNYKPSLILRTSQPLPSFTSDYPLPLDEFPSSMPGPFDTYELGAYEKSIVKLKNRIGVNDSKYFSKKFVHSIIHVDTRLRKDECFQSCALMLSFTQMLAIAQEHGHHLGLPLKEPLNCNCIVTNGVSMIFMVYQLNTTSLHDDRGLWNRAWCSPLMDLYTPNQGFPTKWQFHEITNRDKLEGFNADAVKLFHKLLKR